MGKFFASSVALLALLVGLLVPLGNASPASAVDASGFDPGYIISDQNFYDSGRMTADGVQSWLNGKRPDCAAGYVCLRNYTQTTYSRSADPMCAAYNGAPGESAARIITKVAQACGINPQVLLVLLEKEQSLVTLRAPSASRYVKATGYACPDTADCDARYSGFYNQVYMAAWTFKRYVNPAGTSKTFTWFPVGATSHVRFHPNAACGSSPVRIQNQATASLYYYTPYQPNRSALGNLYGAGDSCGAYGNRNFWRMFSDWFGSATGQVSPIGNFELASSSYGRMQLRGWVLDPETTNPTDVHVYVDGQWGGSFTANANRSDLASAYPGSGTKHGFDLNVAATPGGSHEVCVYGINVGYGSHTLLSCRTVRMPAGSPIGNVDGASIVDGKATVTGWTLDPDIVDATDVHVYVNGAWGGAYRADGLRADVGRAYPGHGNNHGINASVPIVGGPNEICVYGINSAGSGTNPLIGCKTVTAPSGSPIGNIEGVSVAPDRAFLTGWALDPDVADSIDVHVYVNGAWGGAYRADAARPDVGRAYRGYGDAHGLRVTVPVGAGRNEICVYGINKGLGYNELIGCKGV